VEKRELELVFIDKKGKVYPIDEVTRAESAEGSLGACRSLFKINL
jgi:hypothetical protein